MSSAQGQALKCTSLWIHCNRCFYNYTNKQRKIYILSCYHLGCEKCIVIANKLEIICSICKETVKGYPIGNNLPNNLKDLFHPRPWILSFPKICSVLKFQTKQRNSFYIGCKKLNQFKKSFEKERDDLKEECKQIYWFAEKLKKDKTKLLSVSKKLNQISLSKKYAHRNCSSNFGFEMQRMIPSTSHMMSRSRNEDTFDFPAEPRLSTSFYS